MSCDVGLEAPFVDVRFELAPDGDIDVTVGHRGSGVYVACPPY